MNNDDPLEKLRSYKHGCSQGDITTSEFTEAFVGSAESKLLPVYRHDFATGNEYRFILVNERMRFVRKSGF